MAKPNDRGIRGPQAAQRNGAFLNPPRYPEMGGLSSARAVARRTDIEIVPPGNSRGSTGLPPLPRGQE